MNGKDVHNLEAGGGEESQTQSSSPRPTIMQGENLSLEEEEMTQRFPK